VKRSALPDSPRGAVPQLSVHGKKGGLDGKGRVLVVGFDGATWDLLSRYAEDGTMPNLGRLRSGSSWGELRSTIPPVTAPAWASLSTGKNPGKTGVYAFYTPVATINSFRPITSLDVHSETLPEVLEEAGLIVHVINLPTFSYPPKIRGTVLGDILCPSEKSVHPGSLREEEPFRNYRSIPNMSLKGDLPKYFLDIRKLERVRFQCAAALFRKEWDFIFVMFSGIDWIQHEVYGELLNGTRSHATEEALRFFKDLDDYLGWFESNLGPRDHLFLVSDHGFRRTEGNVSLNRWLIQEGFLRARGRGSLFASLSAKVPSFAIPTSLLTYVSRNPIAWKLARRGWRATAGDTGFTGRITPDPATSLAFSQDYTWGVYLNSKSRFTYGLLGEADSVDAKRKIREGLIGLARRGLVKDCVSTDEIYSGNFVHLAPDLIVLPAGRGVSVTREKIADSMPANGHAMDGVYLVHGPGVASGRGTGASICDIYPSVLSCYGLEVPDDLDGESMLGSAEVKARGRPSSPSGRVLSRDDEEQIHGRLRDLGYI
jgi:predicted AlkP superfamily phosphohydrolase/phosphomutase